MVDTNQIFCDYLEAMKNTAYQVGILRDACGSEFDSNIFELCLDVIQWAKNIGESYNSASSNDLNFEDLNISASASLGYAIWHSYSKLEGDNQ